MSTCPHGLALDAECEECPRLVFDLDRLARALEGLDRHTLRGLLGGDGPVGPELARTLAGDAFDKALGIVR